MCVCCHQCCLRGLPSFVNSSIFADYMVSALKSDGLDNVHTEAADVRQRAVAACAGSDVGRLL